MRADCRGDVLRLGPAPYLSDDQLLDAVARLDCAWLVLSGSLPPGLPEDSYACIVEIARSRGIRTFYATVLPINKAMLQIFYNSGYEIKTEFDGDAYLITYELAKRKGLKIVASPGQVLRPAVQQTKKLIEEGAIGTLAWDRRGWAADAADVGSVSFYAAVGPGGNHAPDCSAATVSPS